MRFKSIIGVVGLFLICLSILMLFPAVVDAIYHEHGASAFVLSALLCVGCGSVFVMMSGRTSDLQMKPRDAFVLTTLTWLCVSTFSALPLLFTEPISYTDAFFETMSGITTTGSTVLMHLTHHTKGILLWRSLLQWLGGIGFIVMAVAMLPFLKIGGMRLFQSESSDWSEKALPRSAKLAKRICLIYGLLTLVCGICYWIGGMSGFDAINFSMTTLSTGGFATSDQSMAYYSSAFIHWTGTVFMLLGSLPFVLFVKFLAGERRALYKDSQVQAFLGFIVTVWVVLTLWLMLRSHDSFFSVLTQVAFNTTSVVTTTGFALGDYSLWGPFAACLFFILTFVGGCSGSTAGGIKIFRFQIATHLLQIQLKQLIHPRALFVQTYNGQEISTDILRSLVGFCFFYFILIWILALCLSLLGLDVMTAITGAATAVSNVGPGLGSVIGPAGNFATLPDTAKWLLCVGMLMGRLEVVTVLVIFVPTFWRS